MSETTIAAFDISKIADLVKNLGVPIVAMGVLMWFSWTTIQWERELMLPAIERNNVLMERNTAMMEVLIVKIDAKLPNAKAVNE